MASAAGAPGVGGETRASGLAERLRVLATWTNLWSAAFFVTLVLVRFTPPRHERSIKLDESWQQAYSWFHARGLQAGVDYVFTYGPLAHLEIGHFFAEQFWTRVLAWQLGLGSLVALLLVSLARRIPTRTERGLFTLMTLLAAQVSESWWSLVITGVCVWLLDDAARSRVRLVLGLTVLALASLVKFPYFLLAMVGAGALALVWSFARGKLAGLAVLAGYAGLVAAAWVAAGQEPGALPAYLATSQELARGYAQAMHLPATVYALVLAGIALAACVTWLAGWACARERAPVRYLGAAVLFAALLLAYKSSFVLYDRDGAFFLFAGAAVLVPLAFRQHAPRWTGAWAPRAGSALRAAAIVCALLGAPSVLDGARWPRRELLDIGARCADSARCLTALPSFRRAQERAAAESATLRALPRSAALVGTQPIDFFGVHQAILLQAGFQYRPRPVFQTYAAFTPALMELNRAFYEGERAPPFVAVNLQPFPVHLPTMEDGLALQSIVRHYEPLLSERGVTLWRRRASPPPAAAERPVVFERTFPVGEWLELGELEPGCHVARIEIEPTLLGRLRELVYQPPRLYLEVQTGQRRPHRFTLGHELARSAAILDPLIVNQRDFARWSAGLPVARPRAIRLETEGPFFAREARLVLERAADLQPRPPPDAARELAYPGFGTLPANERLESEAHTGWLYGHEVLVVGAPSELAFEVPPGSWRLRGAYGCEPAPPSLPSIGIDFRIVLAKGAPLLQRSLDPRRVAGDRGMQRLDLAFQCETRTVLVLQTLLRAPKVPPDAAYWSELRIEPASASDQAGD